MLHVTLPTPEDLAELIDQRHAASVSLVVPSSNRPAEADAARLALRGAVQDALGQLGAEDAAEVRPALDELVDDDGFWRRQARSIAVFAAPGVLHAFTLPNRLEPLVAVGDRFDVGPLLRSLAIAQEGWVLLLHEQGARLFAVSAEGAPEEQPLDLPDDLHSILEITEQGGQADLPRAKGATGETPERRRFASAVQDAALPHLRTTQRPLILAASNDLAPAYRAVNRYEHLLAEGIEQHPGSLDAGRVAELARGVLDRHGAAELVAWRQRFEDRFTAGRSAGDLAQVARAATLGQVEELLIDIDWGVEGSIDEAGVVTELPEPTPDAYRIVDEIAARVLRHGGAVRAVRAQDLPNGSPVAALLRYAG
ncbi:hypothetical protein [Arenivirga flava]|uniref:baeRF11 domain-containing protein n=1 Tax=Arenivirga flava TaxID=1930060 RepID=UPI0024E15410|nr:hypothetical protein [Arenivirga flava]